MKVLRVREVGQRDGRRLFRVKILTREGVRHRLLATDVDLTSALSFNRLTMQRIGKRVLDDTTPQGEWHRHLAFALSKPNPQARFGNGVPTDPSNQDQAVRALVSDLYSRLQGMINRGECSLDALEQLLTDGMKQLSMIDDDDD